MSGIERTLFAMARRRDERARQAALARRHQSIAELWAERASIQLGQAAVGTNPTGSMSSILLGLRLGTCQLEFPCVVAGLDATAAISHDVMRGKDLRLVIRPRTPFLDTVWDGSPARLGEVRHIIPSNGRQWHLDHVWVTQMYQDEYLEPTLVGQADLVELGDHNATSAEWTAHLLGAFSDVDRWQGDLANVAVSLEVRSPEPPRSRLEAAAQNPRIGRARRLAEWASWRRDDVTPDRGRLLRAELQFPHPVTGLEAETYLLDHVCRLLHLYSGTRPTLCGLWDPGEKTGRLLDLGRSLQNERRRLVDSSVVLGQFLREVAPGWDALSEDHRTAVKIGMDGLSAMSSDLEPAVTAGAMSLEFLAAAFLPEASNSYDLTKEQRKVIVQGLAALASTVAPGTAWEHDLDRLKSRLFQVPAVDRLHELMTEFGVRTEPHELKAYLGVRNPVTHGRPREATAQEKSDAAQLQLHSGGLILLRKVGYTGKVQDRRGGRALPPRPGSRVK